MPEGKVSDDEGDDQENAVEDKLNSYREANQLLEQV